MRLTTLRYLTLLVVMTTNVVAQSKSLPEETNLFGSEQAEFNQAMKEVPFGWNEHEIAKGPGA
jgi:hypothetical protein